jgi:hypothetical protein
MREINNANFHKSLCQHIFLINNNNHKLSNLVSCYLLEMAFGREMIGHGRHMSHGRRQSTAIARGGSVDAEGTLSKGASPRRRRAVAVADHKSCALIQTRLKLGELV